jgi:riboflavin synthase
MFTGIVEELGVVEEMERRGAGARLRVRCKEVLGDAFAGASISVNGVCLTAVDLRAGSFAADVAPETMARTNLGDLRAGRKVNLERPVAAGGRLGGHIVQGHVDGTGEFLGLELIGNDNWWLRVGVPEEVDRYLVWKGSVAIDGISLTVASIEKRVLGVTVIPHTMANTTLGGYQAGERVNLETDVLAKYVEKLMQWRGAEPLRVEKLKEMGY